MMTETLPPRCLDREAAAAYLGISPDSLDRLRHAGELPIVALPAERHKATGRGIRGTSRRVLFDVKDLDALVERSKERRT